MPILEPEFPAFLIAATAAVVIEVEVPAGAGMAAPKARRRGQLQRGIAEPDPVPASRERVSRTG